MLVSNPEQLMRSRYSAYALGHIDYIMETTHPLSRSYEQDKLKWKLSIAQFCQSSDFQKLEVHSHRVSGDRGFVTFTAYISQNGQDVTFTESSSFMKYNGQWLYCDGFIKDGRHPSLRQEFNS